MAMSEMEVALRNAEARRKLERHLECLVQILRRRLGAGSESSEQDYKDGCAVSSAEAYLKQLKAEDLA